MYKLASNSSAFELECYGIALAISAMWRFALNLDSFDFELALADEAVSSLRRQRDIEESDSESFER